VHIQQWGSHPLSVAGRARFRKTICKLKRFVTDLERTTDILCLWFALIAAQSRIALAAAIVRFTARCARKPVIDRRIPNARSVSVANARASDTQRAQVRHPSSSNEWSVVSVTENDHSQSDAPMAADGDMHANDDDYECNHLNRTNDREPDDDMS